MMKVFVIILSMLAVCSCTTPGEVGEDPDDQVVIPTQADTEVEVTTDGGTTSTQRSYAEVQICSVIITFTFVGDRATNVEFENNNDTTVIVTIEDDTTGGVVAENCLWADNTDGEEVDFSIYDRLTVEVYLGQGQFLQYTCVELIDEVLNIFDFCRSVEDFSFV